MARDGKATALSLVAIGLICQELGASFGVLLFSHAQPVAVVTFRLVFSALVLMLVARPKLRGLNATQWRSILALGIALMVMNTSFYLALERLSLGVTVTIEVLGPLVLSVIMARRRIAWLWAGFALVGVAALGAGGWSALDPIGVLFAAIAGVAWAAYILASARVGRQVPGISGLALAMCVGAVLVLPFGILADPPAFVTPSVIAMGFAVAMLSSTIPYTAELLALRKIPESMFSILMSLGPATASIAGFVILGQHLTTWEIVGITLVIVASMGAVLMGSRAQPAAEPPPLPPTP